MINTEEGWKNTLLRWKFNFFPAYWATGATILFIAKDFKEVRIKLPLRLLTRNYVGTIFGGSMFAASDPIFMVMLINVLGKSFVVWDKSATIRFVRPGRSTLFATFTLDDTLINTIKHEISEFGEKDFTFKLDYFDKAGKIHAKIERTLYIASRAHYDSKIEKRALKRG